MKKLFTYCFLLAFSCLQAQEASFADPTLLFDHPAVSNALVGKGVVPLDHNDDGIIDFVVEGNGIWLYEGQENMTYNPIDLDVTLTRKVLTTLDYDSDGDTDIILETYILINEGDGIFTELNIGLQPFDGVSVVAIADIDGDDDLDLFIKDPAVFGGDEFFIHVNDGNNNFSVRNLPLPDNTNFGAVDSGDIDADGDIDLVITMTFEEEEVIIYWNDGNGQFTQDVLSINNDVSSNSVELEDMDNDGDLEIVAMTDSRIRVYENTDNFETISSESNFLNNALFFSTSDINNDGLQDIICASHDDSDIQISFFENKGDDGFSFQKIVNNFPASNFISFGEKSYTKNTLQSVDVDGDGKKDLVFTDGYNDPNQVVLMKGTGSFVSTKDISLETITLAPNPTIDYLKINDERLIGKKVTYTIVDIAGRLVTSGILNNDVDVSELMSGTYVIILESDKETYRSTFSKL